MLYSNSDALACELAASEHRLRNENEALKRERKALQAEVDRSIMLTYDGANENAAERRRRLDAAEQYKYALVKQYSSSKGSSIKQ